MRFADYAKGYVLQLEQGEEVQSSLAAFVQQRRLPGAFFQGIGALACAKLGYFDPVKKGYDVRLFEGGYELLTANGNVAVEEDIPLVHTHVVLSDRAFRPFGGHLLEGTVSLTVELFLFPMDIALIRQPNDALGLKTLDLPHLFVRGKFPPPLSALST